MKMIKLLSVLIIICPLIVFSQKKLTIEDASGMNRALYPITLRNLQWQGTDDRFTYQENGTYLVNFDKMKLAVESLGGMILTMQGDGDYNKVKALISTKSVVPVQLQSDLDKLKSASIPVDIVFEQGKSELGL